MTFAATVLANAPYSWYRCNEASGTTLADSSGNSRNGTIGGTVSFQNLGFSTDGNPSIGIPSTAAGYLSLSPGGPGNLTSAFTLGFWWRPGYDLSTYTFIASGRGSSGGGWVLQSQSGNISLQLAPGFSGGPQVTDAVAKAGNGLAAQFYWVTYDGIGAWNVYQNASTTPLLTIPATAMTALTGTSTLMVPSCNNTITYAPQGYYSDIMTFGSVVSPGNRAAIYSAAIATTASSGSSPSVVFH